METRFCCLLEHPWQKFSLNHCPPEPPEKRVKKKRRRGSSEFSWISVHELTKKCKCEQTYVERLLYKNKNQLGNSKQYAKLQEVRPCLFLVHHGDGRRKRSSAKSEQGLTEVRARGPGATIALASHSFSGRESNKTVSYNFRLPKLR